MGMTLPPCKGCERRAMGCHSECSEWAAWKAVHLEEKRKIRSGRNPDAAAHALEIIDRNYVKSRSKRRVGQR